MAFAANRVKVSTSTTGTGTFTLGSAASSAFRSFADAAVPDGATVHYTAFTASEFECGEGVYTASGTTLTRDTIFASSNSGNVVSFGSTPTVVLGPLAESFRLRLTEDVTYHISEAGDDTTGDGSLANPWQSPQKAYDYLVESVDIAGYAVTIQGLSGDTYVSAGAAYGSDPIVLYLNKATTGGGNIIFDFDGATLDAQNGYGISALGSNAGFITLRNFAVINILSGASAVSTYWGASLHLEGDISVTGSGIGQEAFVAGDHSSLLVAQFFQPAVVSVSGTFASVFRAFLNATMVMEDIGLTLVSTPAYTSLLRAYSGGFVYYKGITVIGTATGKKFDTTGRGAIVAEDASFSPIAEASLPGDAVGTFANGGTYNERDS
jgi:hypothetical protein